VTRGEQLAMSFDEPDTDTVPDTSAPAADTAAVIATAHNGTKQAARPPHVAGSAVGLRDQSDRDRMAAGVGQRVVAVAGAGSGKTTQLVQRVLTTLAGTADVAPVPSSTRPPAS
jgi:hypothetical protein